MLDDALALHAAVSQRDHPVGHLGDGRVMSDDGGGGPQLSVDPLDHVEHERAGLRIQRSSRLVAYDRPSVSAGTRALRKPSSIHATDEPPKAQSRSRRSPKNLRSAQDLREPGLHEQAALAS